MSLAQLTGNGSFTFRLGGQRFRGRAVCLADYFAWNSLLADVQVGSPEHVAWYVPLLAERLLPGKSPVTIDAEWVAQNVRRQHLDALDLALLEEQDPGDALDTEGRMLLIGKVKVQAVSYTLGELEAYRQRLAAHGTKDLPMEDRLDEAARALRERYRGGLSDPALITPDWVLGTLTKPAMQAFERLLFTGRLPGEPDPQPEAGETPKPPASAS